MIIHISLIISKNQICEINHFIIIGKVPDWSYGKVNLQWNEGKFKKGARKPKLAKELSRNQLDALKESTDPKKYWHEEPILMKSPLSRNKHPVSQWAEEEEIIKQNSIDKGFSDAPIEACDVSA